MFLTSFYRILFYKRYLTNCSWSNKLNGSNLSSIILQVIETSFRLNFVGNFSVMIAPRIYCVPRIVPLRYCPLSLEKSPSFCFQLIRFYLFIKRKWMKLKSRLELAVISILAYLLLISVPVRINDVPIWSTIFCFRFLVFFTLTKRRSYKTVSTMSYIRYDTFSHKWEGTLHFQEIQRHER